MSRLLMFRLVPALAAVAVLSLGAAAPASAQLARGLVTDPAEIASGDYVLDKKHTSLTAKVLHLGYSWFSMRFDKIAGTLSLDAKDASKAKLDVTIDPTSVDTGLPDFDKDIAAEAFDAKNAPLIHYVSKSVERTGTNTARVTGDLSFHGVTRPVVLDVTFNGAAPGVSGKPRVGFSATGTFKRSDFGADKFSQYAGDEVRLIIEAEFSK